MCRRIPSIVRLALALCATPAVTGSIAAAALAKHDPRGTATRVIFRARTCPGQALSAGPRVSPEDQEKIARAMTLPESRSTTARLRETNALSGDFLPVGKDDYAGVASILKDTWGYQ